VAAIAVGNNSGSSTLLRPCPSPPPLPDDLLDIPGQEEPGHFSADTDPRSPPQGIDAEYDDDDFEMWCNTEMFQVAEPESATSPTQTAASPSPANGASPTLAMGDPPLANDAPVPLHPRLPNASLESGLEFTVPPDFGKPDHCFTSADRSVMRLCDTCDKAGSPRHLMDRLFAQLKTEIARNAFDPLHSSITKRDAFMARIHRKFPSPPSEAIAVNLESFAEPITICRFNVIAQLQHHGDVVRCNRQWSLTRSLAL
jgi:hypothetical protein